MAKTAIVDKATFFIMLAGVPALFFIHPIAAILLGALSGIVVVHIKKKMGLKQQKKKNNPTENPDYFMGAGI